MRPFVDGERPDVHRARKKFRRCRNVGFGRPFARRAREREACKIDRSAVHDAQSPVLAGDEIHRRCIEGGVLHDDGAREAETGFVRDGGFGAVREPQVVHADVGGVGDGERSAVHIEFGAGGVGLNVVAVAGRRFQSPGNDGGTVINGEAPGVRADLGAFRNVEGAVYDQRTAEEFDGGAVGIKRADRHSGHRRFGAVKYFQGRCGSGIRFKTRRVVTGVRGKRTAAYLDGTAEELLILRVHRDGAAGLDKVARIAAHVAVEGEGRFVADFDGGFHVAVAHHPVIDPIFAPKGVVGRNHGVAVDGELRGTDDTRTNEVHTVACKLIVFALRDVYRQVVDRDAGRRLRISCVGVAVFLFPLAVDAFKVAAGSCKNHAGGAPRVGMHVERQTFFKRGRVVIAHGVAEIRELPILAVKL